MIYRMPESPSQTAHTHDRNRSTPNPNQGNPVKLTKLLVTAVAALAVGAVIAVAAIALGVIRPPITGKASSLPCEQLFNRTTVEQALAQHADLVNRLRGAGSGVSVSLASPCAHEPDKAMVSIRYTTADEQKAIDTIMRRDGFGVPAQLAKA